MSADKSPSRELFALTPWQPWATLVIAGVTYLRADAAPQPWSSGLVLERAAA